VSNLFKRLSGSKQLEESDLAEPLEAMKNKLIEKNVASDIADRVCESVKVKLLGQAVGTFQRTAKLVDEALREALARILTPNKSIDVLRSALEAKEQGRPYVLRHIAFIRVR
jgi:signal recognition particle receptor subunit alpha